MGDQRRGGGISWTNTTWNPIRGCSRISPGCQNCYAEAQALRITHFDRARKIPMGRGAYDGLVHKVGGEARWTGVVRAIPEKLAEPLRWRRRRRVFVNAMSDLFHEGLPDEAIDQVYAVMARASQHTFQVLTKRAERQRDYLIGARGRVAELVRTSDPTLALLIEKGLQLDDRPPQPRWPLPNVWHGVSVEDQLTADKRVPYLLATPAVVRWVSYEPALASVSFRAISGLSRISLRSNRGFVDALTGETGARREPRSRRWPPRAETALAGLGGRRR